MSLFPDSGPLFRIVFPPLRTSRDHVFAISRIALKKNRGRRFDSSFFLNRSQRSPLDVETACFGDGLFVVSVAHNFFSSDIHIATVSGIFDQ